MNKLQIAILIIFSIFGSIPALKAQELNADSIRDIMRNGSDNEKISVYIMLCKEIMETAPERALELAEKALDISEKSKTDIHTKIQIYNTLGAAHYFNESPRKAHNYYSKEIELIEKLNDKYGLMEAYFNLGTISKKIKFRKPDTEKYYRKSLKLARELNDNRVILLNLAALRDYYYDKGEIKLSSDFEKELFRLKDSLNKAEQKKELESMKQIQEITKQEKDSAIVSMKKQEENFRKVSKKNQKIIDILNEERELLSKEKAQLAEKKDMQAKIIALNKEKLAQQERRNYLYLVIILIGLTSSFLMFKLYQQKRQTNIELNKKQKQIIKQAAELEKNYRELEEKNKEIEKNHQKLIYQEKLASLGHLTAGIAHELRNPLNFVNNFSGLSVELISDLNEILSSTKEKFSNEDKEEVEDICAMLVDNMNKIKEHGTRAERIITGMLAHSRDSKSELERVNLNQIIDEYFKLAYHGAKGEFKGFNANIITDYDKEIGQIELLTQDFSRTILNIVNNACYALFKKQQANKEYKPELTITTKKINSNAEIRIKDNGTGIPEKIVNQIFNPFYTTKPTGEGTGLGLSMSYETITNGHNGKLDVNSKNGEFTEFIIEIPLSQKNN